HQSNGTLTDFRRKFVVLAHGSIFSKVGASSKPGAIQVDHLLAVREVLTELGPFYSLVSVTVFPEPECRAVMLLDGSDECLDLEGDVGLGQMGVGLAMVHG
ncbi:hypothetical protein, partial [Pseudomonas aeruginosa]|uniref:hypothetical protein n=1 Tax=Pseudomonas aeruginosa TaxID=287 RepID=UPI002232BD72